MSNFVEQLEKISNKIILDVVTLVNGVRGALVVTLVNGVRVDLVVTLVNGVRVDLVLVFCVACCRSLFIL